MPRNFDGTMMKYDVLGRKIPKRQIKREVIAENRRRGKAAEDMYRMDAAMRGVELERSPHGKDFIERKRDPFTRRVKSTKYVEIKSSSKAPLSKLQKKTKKKGNYKVVRMRPFF